MEEKMNNELYDMTHATRGKVLTFTKENSLPYPGNLYKAIYAALVTAHKLSLIMREIDETVDRIDLLGDRINIAIEEGNVTAVVMLAERRAEEKIKLKALERLLEKEGPVKRIPKEGELTEDMIQRAREYSFENLLPEELKRGRCKCPVHSGNNIMSFSVKNNYGKCWSCGWHGDTIKYIMDTQGLNFPDAVRKLQ